MIASAYTSTGSLMHSISVLALSTIALSVAPLAAQQMPPVRPLGPVTHVSQGGLLGSVSMVRPLASGGAIVNDITRRQLVLFDADLHRVKIFADSTSGTTGTYSGSMGGLLAFTGDSSLFIDPRSLSMLVLDAKGDVARVMAVPSPRDAPFMVGGPFGTPGFDVRGRIVYRGVAMPNRSGNAAPPAGEAVRSGQLADSAPVYRIDLASRERETLAYIAIPKQVVSMTRDRTGKFTGTAILIDPMAVVDDWALMPDGRVVIVRGSDFHVDWLELDGRWVSTAKTPYNWERLDDDAKARVIDSTKAAAEKTRDALKKAIEANPTNANSMASGAGLPGVMVVATNPDASNGRPTQEVMVPATNMVDAKLMADYRPAFRMGAARADVEGNLWVRTTAPSDGGAIYDVIDGKGQLVDRVKLPFGRVISGFGKGVVYLGVQDDEGARLERARIR